MARGRKLEALADYQRALKKKFGLGEGHEYMPWLRVQDVNSRGNSAKIDGIKSNRTHHTLSEHETCFFYLAEFSDSVIDIREQFPLLPLGKVRTSIPRTKNENFSHLISMGYQ